MRGKIISIHPQDAFYEDREGLIGAVGEFENVKPCRNRSKYVHALFTSDQPIDFCTRFIFYAVKVEPLPEGE